ncbi:sodium channel subunit beta-3-like [Simochromis diagramma]|uniref:sodium channel subunit beta-3-like n=1 Tax=Simochromis diagramma TaxID=43689 RepID=UPI001A7EE878|nr:sodium channel subunit beta-3-like [Simochromis diagramma]XP_039892270.1 sodium channel subunit beta-3-like [Simochromis diagramma]XP_039892271.1 sodium channel subunit beta-3-like [Simochromis diagramma]XP_039892272.1 sodium channel subunit beta-3-like [Simochromis diagramma]XP_039892273.1 sodium channel subunit beta-3-like [Simochromis diagramma]XP_039892274.1 sodium channel subunit beta-3-like [Simochromis diagramma]XP_039892275.1 sodium channel subunit beta-3-like [Simochromis diagramm
MESLIVFLFVISCSVALQQDVQAKFGEDVTLQCQITTDERISVVKWSRPDLNTDGYVYFYRNKRFYENYQHPSFHGRVKLRHPEMKDGDVSVILKNVTFNDTGMYECHIAVRNPVRSKRAHTEISHFIELTVTAFSCSTVFIHLSEMASLIILLSLSLIVASTDQTNITAESGQNISLTCRAPNNNKQILAVQWSRADLKQEYVLLYRDEVFVPDNQHPAFKNRVDLQDRQMKDGDVSLILKDVTIDDTGTYECRVFRRGTKHRISTISLSVVPPDESLKADGVETGGVSRGRFGLVAALSAFVVTIAVIAVISKKERMKNTPTSSPS